MELIKNIFKKDIFRKIEGVIKADSLSDEQIFQEVDEYVITKELYTLLDNFFANYSNTIGRPTEDIGVWIAGYFGSGKSHLLKILSYILSKKRLHSDIIGELFLEKIDDEDFELKQNIKKAYSIPTDTILFNIDQKADPSKRNILEAFVRVFNEFCGYYSVSVYIADFERKLDKRGIFEQFKEKFKEITGSSWESSREMFDLEIDNIAIALSKVENISENSAKERLLRLEDNYSLTIEDFVHSVKDYVDKQDKNYRLVFCVDEVGQFIGEDEHILLNLQTIVETFATICKGQVWIIVTSQTAVADLVKNFDRTQHDFSKILGRFKTKLTLTSSNVNEVIQKRLLDKKDEYKPILSEIYENFHNSLNTLIHFSEGRNFNKFKNTDDFISIYPVIPYQMELFQLCIIELSKNNAFQGAHQSFGERSMLDVIQKVVQSIADEKIKILSTFDRFYDGIATVFRPELQVQIGQAKSSLDEFSIKVLKSLFLVKYVKSFVANLDNITILLIDRIDVNFSDLKIRVQNSLNKLVDNVYIQKVGDVYEFLTDKEIDILNEIKNTEIDEQDLRNELKKWIYDDIIGMNKVRYSLNKHDYVFAKKIDNQIAKGKEENLSLNIITPMGASEFNENKLQTLSLSMPDIFITLGEDFEFEKDLEIFVKTNKYIPRKQSPSLSDQEKAILANISSDNNKRRNKLINSLKEKFNQCKIYFSGRELHINKTEPKNIVEAAFEEAIPSIYSKINMLNNIYTESDLKEIFTQASDVIFQDSTLTEAEAEMLNYLFRKKSNSENITISKLIDYFSDRPYGWYQTAILFIAGSLYLKNKVNFIISSTHIEKNEVYKALTNNRYFSNTIIAPTPQIDNKKLTKAKEILEDMFPHYNFKSIANQYNIYQKAMEEFNSLILKLKAYSELNYPFNEAFNQVISNLKKFANIEYDNFFNEIANNEDEILDLKEDFIEPIIEFMEGEKRNIFDEIKSFININQDNLANFYENETTKAHLEKILNTLEDKEIFKGNKLPEAKKSYEEIRKHIQNIIELEKNNAMEKIDNLIERVRDDENFYKVREEDRSSIIKPLLNIKEKIKNLSNISSIKLEVTEENIAKLYNNSLEKIEELIPDDTPITPKIPLNIILSHAKQGLSKIKDKNELEKFISKLKQKLEQELQEGKEIIL